MKSSLVGLMKRAAPLMKNPFDDVNQVRLLVWNRFS